MTSPVHDAQLPVELRRIKRASKALVAAVGGTTDAASVSGLRQQRISECTLPNTPAFLSLDAVVALEEDAKGSAAWPQCTRALARHHGFELLPLPAGALGESSWHRSIGDISRECGEVVSKLVKALADNGEVDAHEIREGRIIEEIEEAMRCLADLKGLCAAKLGAEGAK